MRTIGKKNINLVRKITRKYLPKWEKDPFKTFEDLKEMVFNELPDEIFDKWEGAYSEIVRIIEEEVFNF